MMESIIRARRDILADQLKQAQQQYDQLEATLHTLDRQLCAMAGGLQELNALLSEDEQIVTNGHSVVDVLPPAPA